MNNKNTEEGPDPVRIVVSKEAFHADPLTWCRKADSVREIVVMDGDRVCMTIGGPFAQPSELDTALEAWQAITDGHRGDIYAHLERAIKWYDDQEGGLYMPDVADDYRAAVALLRAASEAT